LTQNDDHTDGGDEGDDQVAGLAHHRCSESGGDGSLGKSDGQVCRFENRTLRKTPALEKCSRAGVVLDVWSFEGLTFARAESLRSGRFVRREADFRVGGVVARFPRLVIDA
jgi:hypothetical protein